MLRNHKEEDLTADAHIGVNAREQAEECQLLADTLSSQQLEGVVFSPEDYLTVNNEFVIIRILALDEVDDNMYARVVRLLHGQRKGEDYFIVPALIQWMEKARAADLLPDGDEDPWQAQLIVANHEASFLTAEEVRLYIV